MLVLYAFMLCVTVYMHES